MPRAACLQRMKPSLPIAPDDQLRRPDAMESPDESGSDGRWLDVPRLPQYNGLHQSWLWCGRASAAMVYDFYCRAQGKTSEYIGHKTGPAGVGPNGKWADNLRFMGGPHDGEIAAVTKGGLCAPAQIFERIGWKLQEGYLQKSRDEEIATDPPAVRKRFSPILDALAANNPVVIFTRLSTSKNGGHIVVISGWKKQDDDLWLRINDPTSPHQDLLLKRNLQLVQTHAYSFSEYWVRASRLLEPHPKVEGKRLLSYMEYDRIGRYFFVLDQKVDDAKEVVHKLSLAGASGDKAPAGSGKKKDAEAPPAPPAPPAAGGTSLPHPIKGSQMVSAEALTALYHAAEHGSSGTFPLGDNGLFHCGVHLPVEKGSAVCAVAAGEVVAARIGVAAGGHPWGDTGFVLLRHPLEGGKTVYSLLLHLLREPLHPDRTGAGWLRRVLIDAAGGGGQKPGWRVEEKAPTWKDEDKGRFTPTNVQHDQLLDPGVYEEEDRTLLDHGLYLKLGGKWVKVAQDGPARIRELSPFAAFDLEEAAKKSSIVAALKDGKTAVLDADKKDGKRRWTVEAGEPVGSSGQYLGASLVHWSMFSKDGVFPAGALPQKEFGARDPVKLASLELGDERGTVQHTRKLLEALDPKKVWLARLPEGIPAPGEIQRFHRAPKDCWRSRYQAVKGLSEFALDPDAFVEQERFQSHRAEDRDEFKKNVGAFLFWKDLAAADEFPADGKAIFVHPVTALRLMAHVPVAREADEADEAPGGQRLHPHDDVTLILRDGKGPVAEAKVKVKAGGKIVHEGTTDAGGRLLVPLAEVAEQEIEISVEESVVGDKGKVLAVVNETNAPPHLLPGDAPGHQTFNGNDLVPDARMGLTMRARKAVDFFSAWDDRAFAAGKKIGTIAEGTTVDVQRIVFRKDDGQAEAVQAFLGDRLGYAWSIEKGEENLAAEPADHQAAKIVAAWSGRTAHLNDHPVLAGRAFGLSEGAELEVTFAAILATGAPEHDEDLHVEKVKVARGGFAVAFDPHALVLDHNLLDHPRPVYARIKSGDEKHSLRDQALVVDDGDRQQQHHPAPPSAAREKAPLEVYGFVEIARKSAKLGDVVDRFTTRDGKEPKLRKLSQLTGAVAARFVADGNDEVYVGGTVGEMHLATEDQEELTAAEAIRQQKERGKALDPDLPDWVFSKPEEAYFRDNGMTVGVCAQDCKTHVIDRGKTTGCTEEIRRKNLLSCQYGKNELCKKAVKLPIVDGKIETQSCYSALGVCHSLGHDKSKCFLQTVVRGPHAEDRERWYVSIPMKMKDHTWPYHGPARHGNNLRVVLVNARTGAAVVCSMEDYGPSGKTKEGHAAIVESSLVKDELIGWGHICGTSYEARWKLGLHNTHGEPVVLLAFVPSNTPLGPLPEGAVVKLRKTATYDQILGAAPVEEAP